MNTAFVVLIAAMAVADGDGDRAPAEEEHVAEGMGVEEEPDFSTSVNGYGDTRWVYTGVSTDSVLPSSQVPVISNLTEANTQLRFTWRRAMALADASFFYQFGTLFYTREQGESVRVPNQDILAYRPLALINELYGIYNFTDNLNLTVGKKRIVWGPGLVINPTDLLNPPKDPTDPAFQRTGAWLLRLEAPFEHVTFTAVAAGAVLREYGGVPSGLLAYPSYPTYEHALAPQAFPDDRDSYKHVAAIARMYALVNDTDINVMYYFTNHYNDAFPMKSRLGATAQRFVWDTLELHGEIQGQLGSARPYVNTLCLSNASLLGLCAAKNQLLQNNQITSNALHGRLLAGGSYTFGDDSQLTVEYLFDSTGYSTDEFRAYVELVGAVDAARAQGQALQVPSPTPVDPGSPQKYTFNNLRQHYIFITYMKPHIHDDWTLNFVALLNGQDLSGLIAPQVIWSARDWLNLYVYGFLPWDGPEDLRVSTNVGSVSEFGLFPLDGRLMMEVRAFY